MNSLPNKIWRQHFEQGEKQKSQFSSVLSQIGPKEQTDSFVSYFFQTLKGNLIFSLSLTKIEPSLPLTTLKRETIIRSTHTMFQNKLSEVLYEDSLSSQKNFNFCDENKGLIDGLQKLEDRLFQEVLIGILNKVCNPDRLSSTTKMNLLRHDGTFWTEITSTQIFEKFI